MKAVKFEELMVENARRLRELGLDTPEWTERLRNKGEERTAEKRELLRRIDERARAAGREPLKAYY